MDKRYSKTISIIGITCLWFSQFLYAGTDSLYFTQNKIENDLEASLSRILPREDFLIQVLTEVGQKWEKKLIEDETTIVGKDLEDNEEKEIRQIKEESPFMPGFNSDPTLEPAAAPPQNQPKKNSTSRQVYRMVEVPELKAVHLQIAFDEEVAPETLSKAKQWIQTYLSSSFSNKASVNFSSLPLLKKTPPPAPLLAQAPPSTDKEERQPASWNEDEEEDMERDRNLASENPYQPFIPWIALSGVLFILMLAILLMLRSAIKQLKQSPVYANAGPFPMMGYPTFEGNPSWKNKRDSKNKNVDRVERTGEEKKEPAIFAAQNPVEKRKLFLRSIISRSDTFKAYHGISAPETKDELYALLKGPAYEKFIEGLGIKKPESEPFDPPDGDERLNFHIKSFEEFCQAQEWQERQFFGFLQRLSPDQILTVVLHEDISTVCILLRFLKPELSAYVLDALPHDKRLEVLAQMPKLSNASISEVLEVEVKVRKIIERMPNTFFGAGKQEVQYWKNVVNQSQDQDVILEDLEKTNPGIFIEVSKGNFKLEQAKTISPEILKRVLGESDNQELALALSTCPPDLREFFLEALPPKRRLLLEDQMDSNRDANKNQKMEARLALTKRFREMIG